MPSDDGPSLRLEFWREVAIVKPLRPERLAQARDDALAAFFADLDDLTDQAGCDHLVIDLSTMHRVERPFVQQMRRISQRVSSRGGRIALIAPGPRTFGARFELIIGWPYVAETEAEAITSVIGEGPEVAVPRQDGV
jgi:hypothetical protein